MEKKPDKEKEAKNKKDLSVDDVTKNVGIVSLDSLQYHINIVLPESRDQAVYDAIFKSLKNHLGK